MEGSEAAMILIAYITFLGALDTGATALREDQGEIALSLMESAAVALGVPAGLAAVACMVTWFF